MSKIIKNSKIKNILDFTNCKILNNIINDSHIMNFSADTFIVFNSINNIIYLIYTNENNSIISYDLINYKKIIEIKNSHKGYITNFRHILDNTKKRDLVLSISSLESSIKIWNINNYECLLYMENINKIGMMFSACLFEDNNNIYFTSSNFIWNNIDNDDIDIEPIKIFDLNGNKINEIKDSKQSTYFMDTYYDSKSFKIYILSGNNGYITSYDYKKNEIYQKYTDNNNFSYTGLVINKKEEILILIGSCSDGNLLIWNFHSGELLNKIKIHYNNINDLCLWNNQYLFVVYGQNTLNLLNLNEGIIINKIAIDNNNLTSIKKIDHPNHGECLISQGFKKDGIKLWIFDN